MTPHPVEAPGLLPLEDIQGNILQPYAFPLGRYLFVRFLEQEAGRRWLRALLPRVTVAARWERKPDSTLNLAFTLPGLRALGVSKESLASFPAEFQQGMAARAGLLGDVGVDAPERWEACFRPGAGGDSLHAVVLLQAGSVAALEEVTCLARAPTDDTSVEVLHCQEVQRLPDREGHPVGEHFGFADGIAQPAIRGSGVPAQPGQGKLTPDGTWVPLEPGAFLLGHPDELGSVARTPEPEALRLNGTYLVLRKLEQHVSAFRQYLEAEARKLGVSRELLAAKLVGRWRSGAPLVLAPTKDDPELARDPERNNDFRYAGDPDGLRCPFHAHIRRVNPRDARPASQRVQVSGHRMIRRGMPYGPWLEEGAADDDKARGLMFAALCADLGPQFEVVQREWLNNGNITGSLSHVRDAIAGANDGTRSASFTLPIDPEVHPLQGPVTFATRTLFHLPRFVTLKGGAYFFMPGLDGLRYLAREPATAALPVPAPSLAPAGSFLEAYDAASQLPEPLRERTQLALLKQHLLDPAAPGGAYARAWSELRVRRPLFSTPLGFFVSRFRDVLEVLDTPEAFSVHEYDHRMQLTTGPFFLGFDDTARYEREASLARLVVRRGDVPRLRQLVPELAAQSSRHLAGSPMEKVSRFADGVLARLSSAYYGVPGPDDQTLMSWFVGTSMYIFPPFSDTTTREEASRLGTRVSAYLDGLISERLALLERGAPGPDDVLGRLLALRGQAGLEVDTSFIRRTLAGLVSSTLVPTKLLFLQVAKRLLGLPEPTRGALLAAIHANDDALVLRYVHEAARFTPVPVLIYRTSVKDHPLARGTERETLIPAGWRVIVSPGSAMMDEQLLTRPQEFRVDRPDAHYLLYGHGMHQCFGRHLGDMVMTQLVKALLPRLEEPQGGPGRVRLHAVTW